MTERDELETERERARQREHKSPRLKNMFSFFEIHCDKVGFHEAFPRGSDREIFQRIIQNS
jgi:hypothetical protein